MDANLTLSNSATNNSAGNALSVGESASSANPLMSGQRSMLGKEFANIMRGLLPDSERQILAADGQAANAAGLQTVALGQQFALITATEPQPDADSLAAFAKAQGLDDQAVQALFGDLPAMVESKIKPKTSAVLDAPADNAILPAVAPGWFAANALHAGLAPAQPAANVAGGVAGLNGLANAAAANMPAHAAGAGAGLSAGAGIPADVAPLPQTPAPTTPTTDDLNALVAAAGVAVASMQLGKPAAGLMQGAQSLAPTDHELPEPGPLDAIRMRLMPAWENVTRTLAKAAGSDMSFTWASVAAGLLENKDATQSLEIDLGDTIGAATDTGDGLGAVSATFNNDTQVQAPRHNTPASLTLSGQSATPVATDRSAQISQLADKLGQALSERLQDQMAQGQWKLELRLKPAHLGKISVELDMNAGGLDALFKSDNPLTRELIAQSAPRLRDSLAQAGMAVANVWVNADGQQQTGGNPTPRFFRNGGSDNPAPAEDPTVMKVQVASAKSEGWDELV